MQKLNETVIAGLNGQPWVGSASKGLQEFVRGLLNSSPSARRLRTVLNGSGLGHPLHPAVTDVPLGAWTTAVVLDALDPLTGGKMAPASTAAVGFGIGGAIAAAVTGLADWSETDGNQRKIGLLHASLNSTALILYGLSFWRRLAGKPGSGRLLSTAGYGAVMAGAYLGGELVFTMGTQVNRNAWSKKTRQYVAVLEDSALKEGAPQKVEAKGVPVMLVRHEGTVYAMNDVCSHAGCSLARSSIENGRVICRCHGSTFELSNGRVVVGPAVFAQPTYDVRVKDGQIEIRSVER